MPVLHTSSGDITVNNWGYMLQGAGGSTLDPAVLAQSGYDLIVTDFSRDGSGANMFSATEVANIKNGPGGVSVVAAYVSIGEASEFRDHWNTSWTNDGTAVGALTANAPDWLGPNNPDWPESRKVRYWDSDWQDEVFNAAGTGWLDQVIAQGFDAAYLDIVDAYYFWGQEVSAADQKPGDPANAQDAAARMIDFITALTAHARATNPDFFVIPQNGAFILDDLGNDPARRTAYLDAVGAIGVEDIYFSGNQDENNPYAPDADAINILQQDFLANGIPVFTVEYVDQPGNTANFYDQAVTDGFVPFVAPKRALDHLDLTLQGNNTDEQLVAGAGNDILNGDGGNDVLNGGEGNDMLSGGAGNDTASYIGAAAGVSAYLNWGVATGGAGKDTLSGLENLTGGDFADRLVGDAGANVLTGGAGNDILKGKGGLDSYFGGDGNDKMIGGAQTDTMDGGAGDDILIGLAGDDNLLGVAGNDHIYGGQGDDVVDGGAGNDVLRGNIGNDTINGGTGTDVLRGGNGADVMDGGAGNDYLYGENGNDKLYGGIGNDSLTGGAGIDEFIYKSGAGNSFDRVKDFENGTDRIDLTDFNFALFSDVSSLASQTGAGVKLNFGGGNVLLIEGFVLADFDATDVLL